MKVNDTTCKLISTVNVVNFWDVPVWDNLHNFCCVATS